MGTPPRQMGERNPLGAMLSALSLVERDLALAALRVAEAQQILIGRKRRVNALRSIVSALDEGKETGAP